MRKTNGGSNIAKIPLEWPGFCAGGRREETVNKTFVSELWTFSWLTKAWERLSSLTNVGKWFSWLINTWGWWGRWRIAAKVKLVNKCSTCLASLLPRQNCPTFHHRGGIFASFLFHLTTKSIFAISTSLPTMEGPSRLSWKTEVTITYS